METGHLLEFEEEEEDTIKGYQALYEEVNIATAGFSYSTADPATRIAIALEQIAAALERAYPVGAEEGQANE